MSLRIARNIDVKYDILKCAMYSYTGIMIYRKWNESEKRYIRGRYEVIPIDCGISSVGNKIMYAQDYRDHNMTKMFIIDQIERFQSTGRKIRTLFPIKLDKIKRMFRIDEQDVKQEEK